MFANMKVGVRLGGAFALLIVLMVMMLGIAIKELSGLEDHINLIVSDRVPKVVDAEELTKNTLNVARLMRNLLLTEAGEHPAIKEKIQAIREKNSEIITRLDKVIHQPDAKALLSKISDARTRLGGEYDQIFKLVESDPTAARRFVMNDFVKTNDELIAASTGLSELQKKLMQQQVVEAHAAYVSARNTVIGLVLFAVVIALVVASFIVRSIVGPLTQIQKAVQTVRANNDFTVVVPVSSSDEVGNTATAFNELMATLRRTLDNLKESIGGVAQGSQKLMVAAGQSVHASSTTSESASSMAASVEELSVSINQVADNARSASELAQHAGKMSDEGGKVISDSALEMRRIGDTIDTVAVTIGDLGGQSNEISSIVQVIKDVADQTNLLALNAAIEAARAGEAGRGFAVVADEVRKLAERTTKATIEISTMISTIQTSSHSAVEAMRETVEQVRSGRELAEQAGSSIIEIREAAGQVVAVVGSIAEAIAEQSMASQSIAQQLEQVAQAAEENNSAAHETSAASNQLGVVAEEMFQTTARFKI